MDKQLAVILATVEQLNQSGIISRGRGYCMSMSDMIYTLLKHKGIPSRLVECQLTVMSKDPPGLQLVGHEGQLGDKNELDTHVVCITDTETPYLIDLSIGWIQNTVEYIVKPVTGSQGDAILAEYQFGTTIWLYEAKRQGRIPALYQQSITNRIQTDMKIFREISWLRWLIAVALLVSVLNALRGGYDFYQTYLDTTNGWGPKQSSQRIDHIEHELARMGPAGLKK